MRQRSINIESIGHPQPIPLACRIGPILATGGIMGRDSETRVMPEDVAGQAANCFRNLALVLAEAGMDMGDVEIGRASCRESVCQYVSISVVAVASQTTKKTTIKLNQNATHK